MPIIVPLRALLIPHFFFFFFFFRNTGILSPTKERTSSRSCWWSSLLREWLLKKLCNTLGLRLVRGKKEITKKKKKILRNQKKPIFSKLKTDPLLQSQGGGNSQIKSTFAEEMKKYTGTFSSPPIPFSQFLFFGPLSNPLPQKPPEGNKARSMLLLKQEKGRRKRNSGGMLINVDFSLFYAPNPLI